MSRYLKIMLMNEVMLVLLIMLLMLMVTVNVIEI